MTIEQYLKKPMTVISSVDSGGPNRAKALLMQIDEEYKKLEELYEIYKMKLLDNSSKVTVYDLISLLAIKFSVHAIYEKPYLVDFRERDMISLVGPNWAVVPLNIGDYEVKDRKVIIERKSTDFFQSVFDGRLFQQIDEIKMAGVEAGFLIVDKSLEALLLENAKAGRSDAVVFGTVASLALRGFPPIFAGNKINSSVLINTIAEKSVDGKPRAVFTHVREYSRDKSEREIYILTSFPGIGTKNATNLLQRYKDLNTIFNLCLRYSYIELAKMDMGSKLVSIAKTIRGEEDE